MTTISVQDAELAKKYSINPYGMIEILRVFERMTSFIGFTHRDLSSAISETAYHFDYTKPPRYTYEELPHALKKMVGGIISKYGSVDAFLRLPDAQHKFIIGFLKKKYQPKDFLFPGVVTFRGMRRGDHTDNTISHEVIDYEETP